MWIYERGGLQVEGHQYKEREECKVEKGEHLVF